ncbi:unnamed protein product, partial [Meganyctiphanes norvegica]
MGLLTDPGVERSAVPAMLERHHRPVCLLLYLAGIGWFLALAYNPLNHGTYFSENALLPGLVQGDFHGDSKARQYLASLNVEAERNPNKMPHAWLAAHFTQLGLDTYTHNFTLEYPMKENTRFHGRNVYGILRASRSSSTEAVVVSAPYRPPTSLMQGTAPSIALMLAMAHFFSEQVYWAKDIIFLVTEHEQLGIQAWLQAYHRVQSGANVLDHGDLDGRAGSIQAAINLELHSEHVSHIDVKVEGLNGQLPNLDLVNLIHRLCQRENVHHTFKNRDDHPRPETFHGWVHQLKTLWYMIATQATGVPNGNHGLFHRYGIAAVTLEGLQESGRIRRGASLHQLGRVLEGICRSLNNLLERFHQSFFFYLLPSTNRYISIGVYMPPFGLLGGAVVVKALALWYSTSCAAEQQSKQDKKSSVDYSLMGMVPVVVVVHALCAALAYSPQYLAQAGSVMELGAEDSIYIGVVAFSAALLMMPNITSKRHGYRGGSWEVLKCFSVLELAVVLFAGAVYNFSLALVITVIYTPIVLITSASARRVLRIIRAFLLLLIHPMVLLIIFAFLDTWTTFPEIPFDKVLWKTYLASKRALMYSVVDGLIYSNWVFQVATHCLLPIWMLFWNIALSDIR